MEIDTFFNSLFSEDFEEKLDAQVYVCTDDNKFVGFFTLTMNSIKIPQPNNKSKTYSGVLLGQLGINLDYQNHGFGSRLVKKAIKITKESSQRIACKFLIVQTYDPDLKDNFYKKLRFELLRIDKINNRDRYTLILSLSLYSDDELMEF